MKAHPVTILLLCHMLNTDRCTQMYAMDIQIAWVSFYMFRVFYVSLCKWKNLCLLVYILKLSDLSVKMNCIPIKVLATDYESGNVSVGSSWRAPWVWESTTTQAPGGDWYHCGHHGRADGCGRRWLWGCGTQASSHLSAPLFWMKEEEVVG